MNKGINLIVISVNDITKLYIVTKILVMTSDQIRGATLNETWKKCEYSSLPDERDSQNSCKRQMNVKSPGVRAPFTLCSHLSEACVLREEIHILHKTYQGEIQKRDEELAKLKGENFSLSKSRNKAMRDLDLSWKMIRKYSDENLAWTGRTLKFQYLFKEMKKIGLSQSADIFDCFEDIEVPEVSINVKDAFVPTIQTDNIDWDGINDDDDDDDDEDDDDDDDLEIIGGEEGSYLSWRRQREAEIDGVCVALAQLETEVEGEGQAEQMEALRVEVERLRLDLEEAEEADGTIEAAEAEEAEEAEEADGTEEAGEAGEAGEADRTIEDGEVQEPISLEQLFLYFDEWCEDIIGVYNCPSDQVIDDAGQE